MGSPARQTITIAILCALTSFVVLPPLPAVSQTKLQDQFESGDWTGFAAYDKNDAFVECGMHRDSGRLRLYIALGATGKLIIGFINENWQFGEQKAVKAGLRVDHTLEREAIGVAFGKSIYFTLDQDWEMIRALGSGKRFAFAPGNREISFNLKGSLAGLKKLHACAEEHGKGQFPDVDPFG